MREMNRFGIGFWIGAGVYSLVNLILNYKGVVQSKVLSYNYIILGVAIIGMVLNFILLKRNKQ